MALIKEIPTAMGVNAKYWEITQIVVNTKDKEVVLHLEGWADKEAKEDGYNSLENRSYKFALSDVKFYNVDVEKELESLIMNFQTTEQLYSEGTTDGINIKEEIIYSEFKDAKQEN